MPAHTHFKLALKMVGIPPVGHLGNCCYPCYTGRHTTVTYQLNGCPDTIAYMHGNHTVT